MKTNRGLILRAALIVGISLLRAEAAQETEPDSPPPAAIADVGRSMPLATPEQAPGALPPATLDAANPATNGLRLNFRGAPLALVLDYLSDAAGFVINKQTEIRGTVDVWSRDTLSKDEAVALLNSALKKNGCAVVRNGRILTIVSVDNARTSDLEVVTGNDAGAVEKSDEMVTQIIPVRYASASQLVNNLQVLLPASATLSVNESANSLLLVATKRDIRRMLKIVTALDTSIATVSSIKVFPLRYADAKQLAGVVQQVFSSQGSGQSAGGSNARAQLFAGPGGGPFGPPGFAGPGDGSTAGGASGGGAASWKVVAAADEQSNALIVSAPEGLLPTVTEIVQQLDQPVTDITEVRVFLLRNADPTDLAEQLAQLFPDESRSSADQNTMGFRFGGPPPPPGALVSGADASPTGSSDRLKKKSRVLAVADARTSSLLVSAASTLMPQIAKMIEQLDASPARKEIVKVFELRNADPQDVNQVLQDLFNRNSTMRNNNSSRSLLGQSNPLTARQTQQQTSTTTGPSQSGNSGGIGGQAGPAGF